MADFKQQYEVSDELVTATYDNWVRLVETQMERRIDQLLFIQPWLFAESVEYLLVATLQALGIRKPACVSMSLMDSLVDVCDCEAVIVWNKDGAVLDPYTVVNDCTVIRLTDIPWPCRELLLTSNYDRMLHIRKLLYALGSVKSKLEVL